ncbi:hypothetical protein BpHYR1_010081 [Brachionus plicatilis]|uniref:Uncharacterized protein n=1 Tax=Brachionus plicatilis TaxID=10195 RepID=A0A3M7QT34_BRAPC|nr:hypothetical protein BpHYR1_010081 [Brachionus plicatilis]
MTLLDRSKASSMAIVRDSNVLISVSIRARVVMRLYHDLIKELPANPLIDEELNYNLDSLKIELNNNLDKLNTDQFAFNSIINRLKFKQEKGNPILEWAIKNWRRILFINRIDEEILINRAIRFIDYILIKLSNY